MHRSGQTQSLLCSTAGAQGDKDCFGLGSGLSLGAAVCASVHMVVTEDTLVNETPGVPSICRTETRTTHTTVHRPGPAPKHSLVQEVHVQN